MLEDVLEGMLGDVLGDMLGEVLADMLADVLVSACSIQVAEWFLVLSLTVGARVYGSWCSSWGCGTCGPGARVYITRSFEYGRAFRSYHRGREVTIL